MRSIRQLPRARRQAGADRTRTSVSCRRSEYRAVGARRFDASPGSAGTNVVMRTRDGLADRERPALRQRSHHLDCARHEVQVFFERRRDAS